MENILIKSIKENLKEIKNNKVLVLDNLIKNHYLYYSINKDQYFLVLDRLDLYLKDMDYLNILVSNNLKFINLDFIKNEKLFLTIELNFNNHNFIENWINNILDKRLILNFDKIKNCNYENKKNQNINIIELIHYD